MFVLHGRHSVGTTAEPESSTGSLPAPVSALAVIARAVRPPTAALHELLERVPGSASSCDDGRRHPPCQDHYGPQHLGGAEL